jgi:spore photoproduct lyase
MQSSTPLAVENNTIKTSRLWLPKRIIITPDAYKENFAQQMLHRIEPFNIPVEVLKNNRITGVKAATEKETYKLAKNTMAIVNAPPSAFKLRPIPPSADFQFHLAEGCPAHCQYCYLAGSLQGAPVVRVFANLPSILENTTRYRNEGRITSFEASCYTDPLSFEHLTGSLEETIRFFGAQQNVHLRFVTKFAAVNNLLHIPHNGNTRCRTSLNAAAVSARLEGGTASLPARMQALHTLALPQHEGGGGYPIGVVLAPIMAFEGWQQAYTNMLEQLQQHIKFPSDLTFELITHRFTPGSKEVLLGWYPNTGVDMDESKRTMKHNKFGGTKFIYTPAVMQEMKQFFYKEIKNRFPSAKILYWT